MKKRGQTLYELSREQLSRDGQANRGQPRLGDKLQPGGSFRLPTGAVVIGLVLLAGIVVAAWLLGARSVEPQLQPHGGGLEPPGLVVDPLNPEPEPGSVLSAEDAEQAARTPGNWYFVLAETRPDGARRLAAYCRGLGLDAAVVTGHNTRLERVIALPGLDSSSSQTAAYQALDARIRDVGRRWKAQGGTTDLSDRYLYRWTTDQ